MVRFRRFVQDRTVPEPRSTNAPAAWFALGAVALVVALVTMLTASVGGSRSEVARSNGGRITLDIPSGVAADQTPAPPATLAPSTTATVRPTTTAPPAILAPSTTATARPLPTTVPAVATGGIYGQVVATDGTPLPGICVSTDRPGAPAVVRTAADGTFVIDDVLPGPARVVLVDQSPGCVPLSSLRGVAARGVDVVADLWVPVLVTVTLPG
jgi:hypothetical protein